MTRHTREENEARYVAAAHGVQTAVKYELMDDLSHGVPEDGMATGGKHLRTGINLSKSDHAALVKLLIDRKAFTDEEYVEALADAAEDELRRYEELHGVKFA